MEEFLGALPGAPVRNPIFPLLFVHSLDMGNPQLLQQYPATAETVNGEEMPLTAKQEEAWQDRMMARS
jgi:hypothetical protein